MRTEGHLYFHSPCFDGIVSAVLAWDFLESRHEWGPLILHSVNYDLRESWLTSSPQMPCAIVDFLYHPQAEFWCDHHLTTFLDEATRRDFERRASQKLVYDDRAGSCAGLLWNHLAKAFSHRSDRYAELVRWADKIDSAHYESVHEAILSHAPAMMISLGLALKGRQGYCEELVSALRYKTMDQVADLPEVRTRFEKGQSLVQAGLHRFKEAARLESDEIVVFDVDGRGEIINRYAPFYFFPDVQYSAGVVRWEGGAKVTVMRNPWRDFESVHLGKICEKLGGGGHQRVGSIVLQGERAAQAPDLLDRILSEIRNERKGVGGGRLT